MLDYGWTKCLMNPAWLNIFENKGYAEAEFKQSSNKATCVLTCSSKYRLKDLTRFYQQLLKKKLKLFDRLQIIFWGIMVDS